MGRFIRWVRRILSATAITAAGNPAVELVLALIVLGAVIVVWGAMMVRKLLIIVAAVFAPLAFAGATADISTSWVRKWIETMVALVVSKLVLVIIFVIGLGVLTDGLGESVGPGASASATQSITQTIIGALILLMGGFAPFLAIKLVHFGGDHFAQVHGHAQASLAGAQTVAAAPQKAQKLAAHVGGVSTTSSVGSGGWGGSAERSERPTECERRPAELAALACCRRPHIAGRRRWGWRCRRRRRGGRCGGRGGSAPPSEARSHGWRRPRRHRRGQFLLTRVLRPRPISQVVRSTSGKEQHHVDDECGAARPAPVHFGRRSTRGLLLGLSTARCVSAGAAIAVVVVGVVAAGGVGLIASGVLWVPLIGATFVTWQGLALSEWMPVVGHWSARKVARQCEYRARVSLPRPTGTMALPGDAASLRFYEDPETGACMVHDPHRQTVSVAVAVSHPAYVLLSPADQQRRVSAWGRLLGGLSKSGYCSAIQVLEATVPDPGTGVAGWYERHGTRRRLGRSQLCTTARRVLPRLVDASHHDHGRARHAPSGQSDPRSGPWGQGCGGRASGPDGDVDLLAAHGRTSLRGMARLSVPGCHGPPGVRPGCRTER